MRTIERTGRFKRDYKRESKGRHRTSLDASLAPLVKALATDQPLAPRCHDHALSGEWADHRLPHQITGVYDAMLPRQPLRFLLADDPGAGKTIMAGLLIKELVARGDLERCLIVCPGSLAEAQTAAIIPTPVARSRPPKKLSITR